WEGRSLASAHYKPDEEEAHDPGGEARGHGAETDQEDSHQQGDARAIAPRAPATKEHRGQIGPGEGAKGNADLGVGEAELSANGSSCCRKISAVQIHDREEQAKQRRHPSMRPELCPGTPTRRGKTSASIGR